MREVLISKQLFRCKNKNPMTFRNAYWESSKQIVIVIGGTLHSIC